MSVVAVRDAFARAGPARQSGAYTAARASRRVQAMCGRSGSLVLMRMLLVGAVLGLGIGILWAARQHGERPALLFEGSNALEALPPVRLTNGGRCSRPVWSLDGEWIAYAYAEEEDEDGALPAEPVVRVVSKDGAYPRSLTNPERLGGRRLLPGVCLGWGGDRVFFASEEPQPPWPGQWISSTDRRGRTPRRELRADGVLHVWPSPDGACLLVVRQGNPAPVGQRAGRPGPPRLVLYQIRQRVERDLGSPPRDWRLVRGWADTHQVLVGASLFDPMGEGNAVPKPRGVSRLEAWSRDATRHLTIEPPANYVGAFEEAGDLCLHAEGQGARPLTQTRDALRPSLSPDGRCAAYLRGFTLRDQAGSASWEHLSLWAAPVDSPHPGTLLSERADLPDPCDLGTWPAWSPRGDRILYVCDGDLWVVRFRWREQSIDEKVAHRLPLRSDEEATYMMANLKQIGLALMQYAQDYDENFPHDAPKIVDALKPYVRNASVFCRPGGGTQSVFRWTPAPSLKLGDIAEPGETVIGLFDYHRDFRLLLFADGHVKCNPRRP